jgi:hypothetical protein
VKSSCSFVGVGEPVAAVGLAVLTGGCEGSLEGRILIGRTVGLKIGAFVGFLNGFNDGGGDSRLVGIVLGVTDGRNDGEEVGFNDGNDEGFSEARLFGVREGVSDGAEVGELEFSAARTLHGNKSKLSILIDAAYRTTASIRSIYTILRDKSNPVIDFEDF